jgi:hypothetical protein
MQALSHKRASSDDITPCWSAAAPTMLAYTLIHSCLLLHTLIVSFTFRLHLSCTSLCNLQVHHYCSQA